MYINPIMMLSPPQKKVVEHPPDLALRISFSFLTDQCCHAGITLCEMLSGVHEGLDFPFGVVDSATIRGKYEFYHYNVDGTDDRVSMLDCKA